MYTEIAYTEKQRECRNCWWYDESTGVCTNGMSKYRLCNVNEDNLCPEWTARFGMDELPFTEPNDLEYTEGDNGKQ